MERAPENHESLEGDVDSAFEHLVEELKIVGSGKDGIVFRVELNELSAQDRQIFVSSGLIDAGGIDDLVAAKILKVYDPRLGDHEYRMQGKARSILEKEAADTCCAVPAMVSVKDQHITERARRILNQEGAHLEDRAEILVMDFIEGKDLGTMMYEFVLAKLGYDDIEETPFEDKERIVAEALGFELPDLSHGDVADLDTARAITFERNETKLFKYLKREGFTLDPVAVQTIERTIAVLHAHGFYAPPRTPRL